MNRNSFLKITGLSTLFSIMAPRSFARQIYADKNSKNVFVCILRGGLRKEDFFSVSNFVSNSSLQSFDIIYAGEVLSHNAAIHSILNETYQYENKLMDIPEVNSIEDFREMKNEFKNKNGVTCFTIGNTDVAHFNLDEYYKEIKRVDDLILQITQFEEKSSDNSSSFLILPDHGRNNFSNEMGGTDHHHESARNSFCLYLGTNKLNPARQVFETIHIKKLAEEIKTFQV